MENYDRIRVLLGSIPNNQSLPADRNRGDGRFHSRFAPNSTSFFLSDRFYHINKNAITYLRIICRCARTDGDVRLATRHVLEAGRHWKTLHDIVGQSQCVLSESSSRDDVLIGRVLSSVIMEFAFVS